MSTVRAGLLTTIEAFVFNVGETTKGWDYGSTQLAIDNMEGSPFASEVAVFIGDETPEPSVYSHAWYLRKVEYEVLIAEKRVANAPKFETYVAPFYLTLPGSALGGAVGNIINIEITGESEVEKPFASVWVKKVYVTVTQTLPITIGSEFRINATPPSVAISSKAITDWINNGHNTVLSVECNITKGTGSISHLTLTATSAVGILYYGNHIDAVNGTNLVSLEGLEKEAFLGDEITFNAIVTDLYGLCGEATPVVVTIT
jgi:hypothetical protein